MSGGNSNASTARVAADLQRGIVKQVVSGDSVVIRGQAKGGPPPEKQINLAFIIAPKMGRKIPPSAGEHANEVIPDEPWAWEAREFLRKKVIGKDIRFLPEYKVPFSNNQPREFGILMLGEESLVESMIKEGLAEVRRRQNEDSELYKALIDLEEEAKAAGKGKWATSGSAAHRREVLYELDEPIKLMKKTFSGLVEFVRDGSTLRIAMQLEPMKYQMITLMVSGIKCPFSGEPYADQARFFTEARLLNKDVEVRLEQISGSQNSVLIGSVTADGKNIAEHLLREGMGKVMSWTLGLTLDPPKLRAAETEAKSKNLRIWKDHKEVEKSSSDSFDAKVMEVINGDALMVKKSAGGAADAKSFKIFLASVRGPPRPEGLGDKVRPLYDVPFMFEAREFLRKRLIQKKVKVSIDYVQPKNDNFAEKICCTVTLADGSNVAEGLISRGLGSLVKYRMDDDKRSSAYDALQMAEIKAQTAGKGIWKKGKGGSNAEPSTVRIVDLSNDKSKSIQYQSFLLRSQTRKEAVVEYVYSPTRVKVYIPKENCLLNMILAGINSPKATEPYGQEGAAFIRSLVHQTEVELAISSMDKVGNYIGHLHYDNGTKDMSLELLKAGFASIRHSEEVGNQYISAEEEAKKKKLNIWANWTAPVASDNDGPENGLVAGEEAEGDDEGKTSGPKEEKPAKRTSVVITQVSEGMTSFYAQIYDQGKELEELMTEMREELASNPPLPGAYTPKKGDVVVAKYSLDGEWYRAKVEKILGTQVQVLFVDYGNRESVLRKDLGTLPLPASKFSLVGMSAAAKEYQVAFVEVPADGVDESKAAFEQDTEGRLLDLKVEYRDPATGLECATIQVEGKDVVKNLVSEGYFMINLKTRWDRRVLKLAGDYKTAQEAAKKKRLNIWRYGDFTEDDAREFGHQVPASK